MMVGQFCRRFDAAAKRMCGPGATLSGDFSISRQDWLTAFGYWADDIRACVPLGLGRYLEAFYINDRFAGGRNFL